MLRGIKAEECIVQGRHLRVPSVSVEPILVASVITVGSGSLCVVVLAVVETIPRLIAAPLTQKQNAVGCRPELQDEAQIVRDQRRMQDAAGKVEERRRHLFYRSLHVHQLLFIVFMGSLTPELEETLRFAISLPPFLQWCCASVAVTRP
ncbi:hypothetical protein CCMA1212_001213 [Trichoderma ghanense]|uniref:Uncharacterized protein n=1 Tax=Trichoderma ghanense TaxID=65468 RepID=A0ABY2HJV0_9HYPO